jgi:hypothetical protein
MAIYNVVEFQNLMGKRAWLPQSVSCAFAVLPTVPSQLHAVSAPWKTPSVSTSGTRVRSRFTSSRASYVNIVDSNMAGNNSGGSSIDGSDDSSRGGNKGDNSGGNKDDSSDGSKDDNNNDGNSDDNKDGNSDDNRGDDNSDGNSKLAERQF